MKKTVIFKFVVVFGLCFAVSGVSKSQAYEMTSKTEVEKKAKKRKVIIIDEDDQNGANVSTVSEESLGAGKSERIGLQIRPIISYSFISPKALNNDLATKAQLWKVNSAFKINGAFTLSAAADYEVSPRFLVGMRFDWFNASSDTIQVKDANGKPAINVQALLSGLPIYATLTFEQPIARSWGLGMTGGLGVPIFFNGAFDFSGSNIAAVPNGTPTYASTPLTGFGVAFLEYGAPASVISVRTELGYRFLSSSQMKLVDNYGTDKAGTIAPDQSGANLLFDASSFFIGASLIANL